MKFTQARHGRGNDRSVGQIDAPGEGPGRKETVVRDLTTQEMNEQLAEQLPARELTGCCYKRTAPAPHDHQSALSGGNGNGNGNGIANESAVNVTVEA